MDFINLNFQFFYALVNIFISFEFNPHFIIITILGILFSLNFIVHFLYNLNFI